MKVLIFAAGKRIIFFTIVILIEISLKPLAELEVVKISSLDELGHINMSLDAIFVKRLLEHLVVLNKLVFGLGLPLNFTEGEGSWV